MRIVCPECDAKYRVDPVNVPPSGGEMQCSNCWHIWNFMPEISVQPVFAKPDDRRHQEEGVVRQDLESVLPSQRLAPHALAILHEEAARATMGQSGAPSQKSYVFLERGDAPSDVKKIGQALIDDGDVETKSGVFMTLLVGAMVVAVAIVAFYTQIETLIDYFPKYEPSLTLYHAHLQSALGVAKVLIKDILIYVKNFL